MSVIFTCTSCQAKLRTQPQFAGKLMKCPKCGQAVRVPGPPAPASPPEAGAGPARPGAPAKEAGFIPSKLTPLHTFQGKGQLHCFAASADGRRAVSGTSPMCLWDLHNRAAVKTFFVYKDHQVRTTAVSPDGRYALFGFFGRVHVWDLDSGSEVFGSSSGGGDAGVAFFPDGGRALTAHDTFHVWDVKTGAILKSFGTAASVGEITFLDDGRTFLTRGWKCPAGAIRVWELDRGAVVRSFGPSDVNHIACAPGADRVVTSTRNKIELWGLSAGTRLRELTGHAEPVTGLAISADGKTVASIAQLNHSASDPRQKDGTVRLWDADTGKEILREPLSNTGQGVAFLPGHKLLTADLYDLRLWQIADQAGAAPAPGAAPQVVRDALTAAEQSARPSFAPVETKSYDEAVPALFGRALPGLPVLDKNIIEAAYATVAGSWTLSRELMQGGEAKLRPIVEATLRRLAVRRDFSVFKVEQVDSAAQVSTILTNPLRFVPLRVWKGADGLYLCCNLTFYPELMRFQPSDFGA
jgi:hypothetical protein